MSMNAHVGNLSDLFYALFRAEPPLEPSHPLLHAKNTVVTPHVAFATKESMLLRAEIVFDTLHAWLNGKRKNVIL